MEQWSPDHNESLDKEIQFFNFFETAPYHFVRMAHQQYSFSIAFKKQ